MKRKRVTVFLFVVYLALVVVTVNSTNAAVLTVSTTVENVDHLTIYGNHPLSIEPGKTWTTGKKYVGDFENWWMYDLTIKETEDLNGDDRVTVSGIIQHLVHPPKCEQVGAGLPINVALEFDADGKSGLIVVIPSPNPVRYSHPIDHWDVFSRSITASVTGPVAQDIISYNFTLDVRHVPEPATICLLGLGGLLLRTRKRN